jgi:cytochrome c peroxidase
MRPILLLAVLVTGAAQADDALRRQALSLFGRIEAPGSALTPEAELGRALYWDERISLDGKTSCGTCHAARDWGADRRSYSPDARGKLTSRHSPTVFNSVSQPALRWLADRKTAAVQAEGSLTGSLGFPSKEAALDKLHQLDYAAAFRSAYPKDEQPMSTRNYGRAVEAYEATLVTPAPFDRFLGGDDAALTAAQKDGMRAFIATGCAACHSGALLGGMMTQRFGLVKDYWLETGSAKVDLGRFAASKKEEDKYVFRVPMLRNVAKTAPYFHDGSIDTLERAVRVMAGVQLGKTLDDATVKAITAFLDSLTGEVPANYAPPGKRPEL